MGHMNSKYGTELGGKFFFFSFRRLKTVVCFFGHGESQNFYDKLSFSGAYSA